MNEEGQAFLKALEKLRLCLLMAPDLTDRERRIALLMVERVNRRLFGETGSLCSWLGVATLSAVTGYDRRAIQRIREALRKNGVIHVVEDGGRGPRSTRVYGFDRDWAARPTSQEHRPGCGGTTGTTPV